MWPPNIYADLCFEGWTPVGDCIRLFNTQMLVDADTKMAIRSEVCISYYFSLKHLLCSHPLILEHLLNVMK